MVYSYSLHTHTHTHTHTRRNSTTAFSPSHSPRHSLGNSAAFVGLDAARPSSPRASPSKTPTPLSSSLAISASAASAAAAAAVSLLTDINNNNSFCSNSNSNASSRLASARASELISISTSATPVADRSVMANYNLDSSVRTASNTLLGDESNESSVCNGSFVRTPTKDAETPTASTPQNEGVTRTAHPTLSSVDRFCHAHLEATLADVALDAHNENLSASEIPAVTSHSDSSLTTTTNSTTANSITPTQSASASSSPLLNRGLRRSQSMNDIEPRKATIAAILHNIAPVEESADDIDPPQPPHDEEDSAEHASKLTLPRAVLDDSGDEIEGTRRRPPPLRVDDVQQVLLGVADSTPPQLPQPKHPLSSPSTLSSSSLNQAQRSQSHQVKSPTTTSLLLQSTASASVSASAAATTTTTTAAAKSPARRRSKAAPGAARPESAAWLFDTDEEDDDAELWARVARKRNQAQTSPISPTLSSSSARGSLHSTPLSVTSTEQQPMQQQQQQQGRKTLSSTSSTSSVQSANASVSAKTNQLATSAPTPLSRTGA